MTTHTLIAQNINSDFIQVVFSGRSPILIERPEGEKDSPMVENYLTLKKIAKKAHKKGDWDRFLNCISPNMDLAEISQNKSLSMTDGTIEYKGYKIQNGLAVKIVSLRAEQFKKPKKANDDELVKLSVLLGKVMKNSSKRATDSIWAFLKNNRVNLTDNGDILLYGVLDENGNLNGNVEHNDSGSIEKPRNMVNDVAVDDEMYLNATPPYVNGGNKVGVYRVNPKHIVYVGGDRLSVCKMSQIDTLQGA